MTVTFNDTTDLQGLFQHTKFITGQDNLTIKDFTRLANFAMDDYSYLAITSDGRWKFKDTTDTGDLVVEVTANGSTEYTLSIDYLMIDRIEYSDGEDRKILEQVDVRDNKGASLEETYKDTGSPEVYDLEGNVFKPYPAPSSGTFYLYISRAAEYFDVADTTATVGLPRVHHQFITLHASHQLMMRTNDKNIVQVRNELERMKQEIRDFYSKRDEDAPRRLKAKVHVAV